MLKFVLNSKKSWVYLLLSLLIYLLFAFVFERKDFEILFVFYTLLFLITSKIIKIEKDNFKMLLVLSLIFRMLFLFQLPTLSQDYFRFIWDGRMIFEGLNPYLYLPNDLINDSGFELSQANKLYQGMGNLSASHFSNYPPINQLFFFIASLFSNQSVLGAVVILRVFCIAADFGIFYFGSKLLVALGFNKNRIFWYLLNPLVIIELTGNLHFEGVMLFFFIWGMYMLFNRKLFLAALLIALSISTKLLPLVLLPVFLRFFKLKELVYFYVLVIGLNVLLFLPFLSQDLITKYGQTIGLWFTNFEFNASVYYLIREIGYWIKGYNIIHITGKIIPIFMVGFILYRGFANEKKDMNQLFLNFLIVLSVYFFLSTTVHPWYVINVLLVSLFTKYNFALLWSWAVFLSYHAYSNEFFKENLWLIGLEYVLVFVFLFFERQNKLEGFKVYI